MTEDELILSLCWEARQEGSQKDVIKNLMKEGLKLRSGDGGAEERT